MKGEPTLMADRTPDLREAQNDLVRVSLRNDIIFRYVFGHERNEKILRALLNALLNLEGEQKIESLIFPSPVNLKTYLNAKHSCLDVSARDGTGKRYNIEMQVRGGIKYIARAIYYHDRLFSDQLVEREEYHVLKKTLSISILNFVLLSEEYDLHNVFRYGNIKSRRELADIKELHFVELPKFAKDKPRQLMTRFEKWLYVLKFGEIYKDDPENLPAELKAEEEIVMAVERMHEAEGDAVVRELMEARQKALHDEASWRRDFIEEVEETIMKKGMEKGMEKASLIHAREMKALNVGREIIKKVTGIDIDSMDT